MAHNLSLKIISLLDKADLRKISERAFQDAVLDYAQAQGWKCHWMRRNAMVNQKGEWHPLGSAGFPDVFAIRRGSLVALELKSERGVATHEQMEWLGAIERLNVTRTVAHVMVAKPRDAAQLMRLLE